MNKFLFYFLLIGCFLQNATATFAVTFEEVDFEQLVLKHPLMKNYDNKTGYFHNTDYELVDVEKLKIEVKELTEKLESLNKKKDVLASKSFDIDEDDEESFWEDVGSNTQNVDDLKKQISNKKEIILDNGIPPYEKLFYIINQIASDTLFPLYDKNKIVFNKLPKSYRVKPIIKEYFYNFNKFLNEPKNGYLVEYIELTRPFVCIFPDYNKTVLFNEDNQLLEKNKIGTIDLELAFVLHPKMALYNYEKIGFNKYKLGLTNKECSDFNAVLNKDAPDKSKELEKIKNELEKLEYDNYSFYNNIMQGIVIENAGEKIKKIKEQIDLLQKKKFDVEYAIENPELTTPEETINIFNEIYDDVNESIKSVIKEKEIQLLLNQSLVCAQNYNVTFSVKSIMGLGHAGINYTLFYSFYNDNKLSYPIKEEYFDYLSNRWFDFSGNKNHDNYFLYLNPYPIVLSGGESILKDVVKEYYKKYNIASEAIPVLNSVISEIEVYQHGSNK